MSVRSAERINHTCSLKNAWECYSEEAKKGPRNDQMWFEIRAKSLPRRSPKPRNCSGSNKKRILLGGPHIRVAKGPPQGLQERLRARSQVLQNASESLPRGVLQVEILKAQFLIHVLYGVHVFDKPRTPFKHTKRGKNASKTSTSASW